jgi:hypothetical protein
MTRIPEWGTRSTIIYTWRNIFFFEGLLTIISGLIAIFLIPTRPSEAWFLDDSERSIAAARLVDQGATVEEDRIRVNSGHITGSLVNINNNICALGVFAINTTVQGITIFMV